MSWPAANTTIERLCMSFKSQDQSSHLFLVRVRAGDAMESLPSESKRWSGRVQRVVTGEAYDFRGWAELIEHLGTMLDDTQAANETSE
jgi:hypothetical protein